MYASIIVLVILVAGSCGSNFQDFSTLSSDLGNYQIGAGIYDITGPIVDVGFMGYGTPSQVGAGLSFRLRARAYVFVDPTTQKRIAFVSTDSCMVFTAVKQEVVAKLQSIYGNIYSDDNVLLTGIHTHSGPAGYSDYVLYNIMSMGFHHRNFDTIVSGIVASITMAHENLSKGGSIYFNVGQLFNSSISRSPTAYANNPTWEKDMYKDGNTDKNMTLLRLEDENGNELGSINWFAVHGTSMNHSNKLVSGDNKGYASYLFEKLKNGVTTKPGFGSFVAAFSQTNSGDVSPNTKGAFCDNGEPCEEAHSTCGGTSENCHGYGPGDTDFESTLIIGDNQFEKAVELYESATEKLTGPIDYIHTFINMGNITVSAEFSGSGKTEYTCSGSLGDSFAAGTTDGPGEFDFTQGNTSNPYWNFIGHFLHKPSPQEIKCQGVKPILLDTGSVTFPALWTPQVLPIQLYRIGQLFIIAPPGEFTTMAGRRLRNTVRSALIDNGIKDPVVVIAALANAYSHYVTTYQEYLVQRYEGASTLYGPYTLAAYQQEFHSLAVALAKGQSSNYPAGTPPPTVPVDWWESSNDDDGDDDIFCSFGKPSSDVQSTYKRGMTVSVTFESANPSRDYRIQDTYLTVEKLNNQGDWEVILTDGDAETRLMASYKFFNYPCQWDATIQWDIPTSAQSGTYRIQTFGSSKEPFRGLKPYVGTSSSFIVE